MSIKRDIRKEASDLFNSLPQVERKFQAGLGYSLAQLTTIKQIRQKNKENWQSSDRKLAEWQKNIEKHLEKEYLND